MKRISIFVLLCVLVFTATAGAAGDETLQLENNKLKANQTLTGSVTLNADLDLDGKTLTLGENNGVLTVAQDVKITNGKIVLSNKKEQIKVTGGTLTLGANLEITGNSAPNFAITASGSSSTLLFDGANVTVTGSSGNTALIVGYNGATINIKSGTLKANDSVVAVRSGKLIMTGGTVEDTGTEAAVCVIGNASGSSADGISGINSNNISEATGEITGGEIKSTGEGDAIATTAEGINATTNISSNVKITAKRCLTTWNNGNGEAKIIVSNGTFDGQNSGNTLQNAKGTIEIKNGTFNNVKNIKAFAGDASKSYPGTITIDGGTFSGTEIQLISTDSEYKITGTKLEIKAGIFQIGTNIKTSADLLAFVPEESKASTTIVEHEGYFYVNTEIPTTPAPAPTPSTPTTTTEKVEATVEGGELEYEIASGQTATVEEVLDKLTPAQLAQVEELPISDQITEVSTESLKKLPNLQSLDLSNATNLTKTSLDLDGVKVGTVTMSKDTKVTELKLSASSDVKAIEAAGTGNLKSIDLAGNKNIETVNVANTSIDKVDASGCSKLETLNTKGAKLTELKVDGCVALADLDCSANDGEQGEIQNLDLSTCTNLEKLKVSGNRLLFLDLSKQTKLKRSETSLGRQNSKKAYQRSREFDLMEFILSFLDSLLSDNTTQAKTIAGNITSVVEVDDSGNEIQSAEYDAATGVANFAKTPTKNVKYIYDTKAAFSAGVASVMLADDSSNMDVTLSGGTDGEVQETTTGSSGGGCSANGLGMKSALMLLAFFGLAFMKIKRA